MLVSERDFVAGICVVCAGRGAGGLLCRRRSCQGRFLYDERYGLVKLKANKKVSKAQKELFLCVRKWAKGLPTLQEVILPWSVGPTGAAYRYDIAVPDLKLLVEYDSSLHFRFNRHFHHTRTEFMNALERDKLKNDLARDAGWSLVRVAEGVPGAEFAVRAEIERLLKEKGSSGRKIGGI